MYTSVAPCNANSAPATCPAPGFPANYLGTVNLKTGAISPVTTMGAKLSPKGLIFVPGLPGRVTATPDGAPAAAGAPAFCEVSPGDSVAQCAHESC